MWKVQTGEQAPFWCTLLVFNQAGGQCFMPCIIVHQYNYYSKDTHFSIPLEYTVHHTRSGYMDKYGWLGAITQFSNECGASPVKNQIIFFDGHDRQFYDIVIIHIENQNIQPFVLKSGDYVNDQTNDNVPNAKIKSNFNEAK